MGGEQKLIATVGLLLILFVIFGVYRNTISAILFNSTPTPGPGPITASPVSPSAGGSTSTGSASGPRDYPSGSGSPYGAGNDITGIPGYAGTI